jgi:hypothetical protein
MSSDSFAVFRRHPNQDLSRIAENHLQNDLRQSDRDALKAAAAKVSRHATVGSLIGLGLGIALGFRVRANRQQMFAAFRAMEKPKQVVFEGGRTGTQALNHSICVVNLIVSQKHYLILSLS